MPPPELDATERQLLERSKDPGTTRTRIISVIIAPLVLIGMILYVVQTGLSAQLLGWVFVAYVAVTAWEKVAYGMAVLRYKRLIQKLVDRIEELEREEESGGGDGERRLP
jgi:Na+/H+-dicarboxylate symporter